MSDRGIKKWNAYKSLVEQQDSLSKIANKKKIETKPLISNERAEEINEILSNYKGEEVNIKYFRNNRKNEISTYIKKVDTFNRQLLTIDSLIIKFSEIYDLSII